MRGTKQQAAWPLHSPTKFLQKYHKLYEGPAVTKILKLRFVGDSHLQCVGMNKVIYRPYMHVRRSMCLSHGLMHLMMRIYIQLVALSSSPRFIKTNNRVKFRFAPADVYSCSLFKRWRAWKTRDSSERLQLNVGACRAQQHQPLQQWSVQQDHRHKACAAASCRRH